MAKNGAVKTLLGLLLVIALLVGGAYALLYGVTHPPREKTQLDPADLLLRAEDVTFHAADGVLLSGWLVKGTPRAPVIVLCHDLGGSRSALLNSAVSLNRAGYALLVFDFRGHGLSMGSGGYLGVDEKSDILGAIAFLKSRSDVDGSRVGLWGGAEPDTACRSGAGPDPSAPLLRHAGAAPDLQAVSGSAPPRQHIAFDIARRPERKERPAHRRDRFARTLQRGEGPVCGPAGGSARWEEPPRAEGLRGDRAVRRGQEDLRPGDRPVLHHEPAEEWRSKAAGQEGASGSGALRSPARHIPV